MPQPRQILGEISGNAKRGRELSPWERAKIIEKRNAGLTYPKISEALGIAVTTCKKTVKKHATSDTKGLSAPRSGRPTKCDDLLKRRIIRFCRTAPDATYAEVIDRLQLTVSKTTIKRVLQEQGISNWQKKKRPALTKENARKRLLFCRQYKGWSADDWKKVIWSDECSVERGSGKQRRWVFRTPQQKWDRNMVQPVKKGKDISVMIWAAFSGARGRSELVVMERDGESGGGGYSAESYLTVLRDQMDKVYENDLIFMQDNAPIHTARKVKQWLQEREISPLTWPPYSPDLNPIENLWFTLKEHVYKVNPHIEQVTGPQTVRTAMERILLEAWQLIPAERFEALWQKYPKRIRAVLKAKGWWTKY